MWFVPKNVTVCYSIIFNICYLLKYESVTYGPQPNRSWRKRKQISISWRWRAKPPKVPCKRSSKRSESWRIRWGRKFHESNRPFFGNLWGNWRWSWFSSWRFLEHTLVTVPESQVQLKLVFHTGKSDLAGGGCPDVRGGNQGRATSGNVVGAVASKI